MAEKPNEHGGEDEKFINTVIQYPFLYDKREKLFKNATVKNNTWHKIGQIFGITGDEAVKYFKGLREKYLRIKRKKAEYERSGAGASFEEKWHLFELLRFLDEILRPRKTISNLIQSGKNSQTTDSEASNITPSTEDETEIIQVEFLVDDTSQDPIEVNVVSPVAAESALNKDSSNNRDHMRAVGDQISSRPAETPTTSRISQLHKPTAKKGQKMEEKVSMALEQIADSLKSPHNEYITTFCAQLEQEMMRMSPDMMEEFKDEVTELLLQKRKQMRSKRQKN